MGVFSKVDDEDYEWLSEHKWYAKRIKRKNGIEYWYAARWGVRDSTIFMHREIGSRMSGEMVWCDHKDGDGLNNQRLNLRPCTPAQNNFNRRKSFGKSSKFKGVTWHKRAMVWQASIMHGGKSKFLGYFKKEEEAAKAYDLACASKFGEFGKPNLVNA